ncbi:membrane protein [Streptococcus pseudoporcinus]|nr:membrane protein [Streptococcus pseudoporcinus]
MEKMRDLKITCCLALFVLGLVAFLTAPQVSAEELVKPVKIEKASEQTSGLTVNAQLRTDHPIVDCKLAISPELAKGGEATVQLLDSQGNILATIPYQLQAGWQSMTAWFDMTGYKAGDYSIKVIYNGQSVQTDSIHYQLK